MKIFLFAFYKVPLSQQEVLFPAKESEKKEEDTCFLLFRFCYAATVQSHKHFGVLFPVRTLGQSSFR